MRSIKMLAVALAVVGLAFVGTAPASADGGHAIYVGTSDGWGATGESSGSYLRACINTWGGTYARVHFKNQPFGPVHHTGTVYNNGCTDWEYHPSWYQFRICHSTYDCSAWHYRV